MTTPSWKARSTRRTRFRTRIDILICVILTIGLYVYLTGINDVSIWYGWSVTAIYGYARVQDSNARRVQTA